MQPKSTQPIHGGYSSSRRWRNTTSSLFIIVLVFFVGIAVGDGRVRAYLTHSNRPETSLPDKLDMSSVQQVYQSLKNNYDGKLSATELVDGLKHGLAAAANDPYTTYFTSAEAKSFNQELNNTFSGIGAQLGTDSEGNIEVISPISGLPADKAGIKAQDIIASINGLTTTGMSVDQAVLKIRGHKGTTVTLQVIRNKAESLNFTITRDNITLPSVKSKILVGNIGYVQISTFADDTTSLMQKAADNFKSKKVSGIILDLRGNPGGLLNVAVSISSLWLEPGKLILQEKQGSEVIQTYNALGGNELIGIPTVILINQGSASASEITTGALLDNKLAYVIGEKSYGKGVVQQLINFNDGSQLKVTIASWYRPNGQNINRLGITPNKVVTISATDSAAGIDTQLQAAQAYLKK